MNNFFRELLQLFVTMELIKWSALCENYEAELRQAVAPGNASTEVFSPNTEDGDKRWKDLKNRVVEHVSRNPKNGRSFKSSALIFVFSCRIYALLPNITPGSG